MNAPIGFKHREPRYQLLKDRVFDRWEQKEINIKEMIIGHQCAFIMPERYILTEEHKRIWRAPSNVQGVIVCDNEPFDDRKSDERIKTVPEDSSTGMLGCPKDK